MIITALCAACFSLMADMPRDYYPNTLEGKSGAELKTELHNLLKNHTRIAYPKANNAAANSPRSPQSPLNSPKGEASDSAGAVVEDKTEKV